jgi:glycosyl transferase family 8
MKTTIVSASDEVYYPLLKGLLLSIFEHRPNRDLGVSVINLGMSPPQLQELRASGVNVAPGRWDLDFKTREHAPRWMQAMAARPHLPNYFPEFDRFIWIDADAWLADWKTIDLLQAMATGDAIALAPEIHRAYPSLYRLGIHSRIVDIYVESFGETIAKQLGHRPLMNSGVFALRRQSPLWKVWSKWAQISLDNRAHKLAEQNALNAAIYLDGAPFAALPASSNWMCGQARPMFNAKTGRLVEPILPFDPISIVHVSPREIAESETAFVGGGSAKIWVDYIPFRQWRESAAKTA